MLRELSNFKICIRDDPIELLKEVEKQVHVPMRAAYPALTIIESLSSLLTMK